MASRSSRTTRKGTRRRLTEPSLPTTELILLSLSMHFVEIWVLYWQEIFILIHKFDLIYANNNVILIQCKNDVKRYNKTLVIQTEFSVSTYFVVLWQVTLQHLVGHIVKRISGKGLACLGRSLKGYLGQLFSTLMELNFQYISYDKRLLWSSGKGQARKGKGWRKVKGLKAETLA